MLKFDVKNQAELKRRFDKIQKYLSHEGLRKEMETTRLDLYTMIKKTFRNQGPKGKKWQKLKGSTKVMRRRRLGYYSLSHKTGILLWTGNLLASLTGKGPQAITRIVQGCLELWLGTRHPLARLHHEGASFIRPAITADSGKALRWFSPAAGPGGGRSTVRFASYVESARISIPARPFWSHDEVKDIAVDGLSDRIEKRVYEIWNGK